MLRSGRAILSDAGIFREQTDSVSQTESVFEAINRKVLDVVLGFAIMMTLVVALG